MSVLFSSHCVVFMLLLVREISPMFFREIKILGNCTQLQEHGRVGGIPKINHV